MRTGTKILATSRYDQMIYPSKRKAAEAFGVNRDLIDRYIEERTVLTLNGKEYWLDELIEPSKQAKNTNLNDLRNTYPCRDCGRYVHPPYCPFCGGNVGKYPTLKEAMERLKASSERSEK